MLQTATAGNLHADDGDAFDIVVTDNFGQLPGIIYIIQLRASYQGNMAFDEALMKGRIGVGSAIRCD